MSRHYRPGRKAKKQMAAPENHALKQEAEKISELAEHTLGALESMRDSGRLRSAPTGAAPNVLVLSSHPRIAEVMKIGLESRTPAKVLVLSPAGVISAHGELATTIRTAMSGVLFVAIDATPRERGELDLGGYLDALQEALFEKDKAPSPTRMAFNTQHVLMSVFEIEQENAIANERGIGLAGNKSDIALIVAAAGKVLAQ